MSSSIGQNDPKSGFVIGSSRSITLVMNAKNYELLLKDAKNPMTEQILKFCKRNRSTHSINCNSKGWHQQCSYVSDNFVKFLQNRNFQGTIKLFYSKVTKIFFSLSRLLDHWKVKICSFSMVIGSSLTADENHRSARDRIFLISYVCIARA